jgi:hypothetical protein
MIYIKYTIFRLTLNRPGAANRETSTAHAYLVSANAIFKKSYLMFWWTKLNAVKALVHHFQSSTSWEHKKIANNQERAFNNNKLITGIFRRLWVIRKYLLKIPIIVIFSHGYPCAAPANREWNIKNLLIVSNKLYPLNSKGSVVWWIDRPSTPPRWQDWPYWGRVPGGDLYVLLPTA